MASQFKVGDRITNGKKNKSVWQVLEMDVKGLKIIKIAGPVTPSIYHPLNYTTVISHFESQRFMLLNETNTAFRPGPGEVLLDLFTDNHGCKCGGFKTYNSVASHYHSRWCDINEKATKG